LLALALGEDGTWERIPRLLTGHVASLDYIVQDWSNATGVEKGQLLKRWAHGLFPVANQSTRKACNVLRSFKRVGAQNMLTAMETGGNTQIQRRSTSYGRMPLPSFFESKALEAEFQLPSARSKGKS